MSCLDLHEKLIEKKRSKENTKCGKLVMEKQKSRPSLFVFFFFFFSKGIDYIFEMLPANKSYTRDKMSQTTYLYFKYCSEVHSVHRVPIT